jgi:hypothetical protein
MTQTTTTTTQAKPLWQKIVGYINLAVTFGLAALPPVTHFVAAHGLLFGAIMGVGNAVFHFLGAAGAQAK